jgi:hypothetical protein
MNAARSQSAAGLRSVGASRRALALCLACLLALSQAPGCSKPLDPQSSIPAAYQPLVFLLGAVGLGFGIAALTRHNGGHSPGPPVSLVSPVFVGSIGVQSFDLALDPSVPGAVGALNANHGPPYTYSEVSSSTTNAGSYTLPAGYQPQAVAVDGTGADWFVDVGGKLVKCPPPAPAISTCVPLVSMQDGLGTGGIRAIAADSLHVFVARDDQVSTVSWAAFALDGSSPVRGSYSYSGAGLYARDAAVSVAAATVSTYVLFHKDGSSWTLPLPGPATRNPFVFTPAPSVAGNVASDGSTLFYGLLGTPSLGSYQIARYAGGNPAGGQQPGSLVSRITIAFNGQTSPGGPPFAVPVSSLHTDGTYIYMLDANGNLVLFTAF